MKPPRNQMPAFGLEANQRIPEVVVYWDKDFQGESWRTNLSHSYVGDHWNGLISSIIVVSGTWEFWSGIDFTGCCLKFGQGYYPSFRGNCGSAGFVEKSISSFRCVSL